jgi:hypothetical protein
MFPHPEQHLNGGLMSLRDEHFKRLNAYRDSREYVEYATKIGVDTTEIIAKYKSTGELKTLLNTSWSIDANIYNEFLNMLTPLNWRYGSFLMREMCFGTITTKYMRMGDRYFCMFVDAAKEPRE